MRTEARERQDNLIVMTCPQGRTGETCLSLAYFPADWSRFSLTISSPHLSLLSQNEIPATPYLFHSVQAGHAVDVDDVDVDLVVDPTRE